MARCGSGLLEAAQGSKKQSQCCAPACPAVTLHINVASAKVLTSGSLFPLLENEYPTNQLAYSLTSLLDTVFITPKA